jgi:spore maturation protein CgeB
VRFVLFVHSLLSDWNHGNAHFLRGVTVELQSRGHDVRVYEPADAWSVTNLIADHGEAALDGTRDAYPSLRSVRYDHTSIDLDAALDEADVVIVHEWNSHDVVRRIGEYRARRREIVLLFHDTHHRSVSDPAAMEAYDLSEYDGVLAFGDVVRARYLDCGWATRAWTWHEAADVRRCQPRPDVEPDRDLVWIGNWGDDERGTELREFLLEPSRRLRLNARVHGVRYPQHALDALSASGIAFEGWLPNYCVPDVFARHRVTVHVPRRPYVQALRGIPTIRPFEALACGIPLVSAPWHDDERLFRPGVDYLVARRGAEMERHLRDVLHDRGLARSLAQSGRETILSRHTCAHRVDELLTIVSSLNRKCGAALHTPPTEQALTT